jgi:septal ring factor EnvC (AmiA/AmiB activator)
MPEEEKKEVQEPQDNPGAAPESNPDEIGANGPSNAEDLVPTSRDLEAVKAELEEEKKAIVDAQALLSQRDARIAELEAQLSEVLTLSETKGKELEATAAELASAKEAHSKAVSKYLDAVKMANSHLPPDVIAGSTIEEIDASVAKALSIANAVKANLEAQAKEAKVPAGAPARGEISLEGLSPREKIAAGIQQGSQR